MAVQTPADSYRILLVEDDPGDAALIGEALRGDGAFELVRADCLAAALERLEAESFDAILLDLGLPDSAGLETLAEMLGRTRVPILVLTGTDDEAAGLQAIRHGAQDHLVKERCSSEVLPRSLRYAIERWRLQAAVAMPLAEIAPVGLAALAEMRRQTQAIGESIPFGIWVAEPDGRMRYLSESFLGLIGMGMADARNFGWMEALVPETAESTMSEWQECVAASRPWNHELLIAGADGRRRTILSRGVPVRDEGGRVTSWAGLNLDITDRREGEEFREAFTGILSHELGTPVTAIYAASTLLRRPGCDEAQRLELLEDIGHEAERLRHLVEDLVVLAKAERGTIHVHTEPVLLQHILPKVCEQEQARWANGRIELSMASPLPVAQAEEALVAQVLRGLLGNAAKYSPAGSTVKVVVDAPDGAPRVRVLDEGPGVDPAEAERLFELFYRSERTSRVAGSGMGLFVAHRLIESMGGTIWARPRDDGPGAEFGFRLQPLTEDAP